MKRTLSLSVLGAAVCAAILSITLLAGTTGAAGPNLLTNGDFSQGSTSWTPQVPTTLLQPFQAGALSSTQTEDTPSGFGFNVFQCVDGVSDLHEYTVGGDVVVPAGQGRSGSVAIWAGPNDGPGCSGFTDTYPSTGNISSDVWSYVDETFVPPDGTKSIKVILRGSMAAAGPGEDPAADFTVAFDNVFLTQGAQVKFPPETPTPEPGATLEICKHVQDNADANVDGGTFTFSVAVQGQPPFLPAFPVTASEVADACDTVMLSDYGIGAGGLLTVAENPLGGWTNQATYPRFSANNGPLTIGTSAGVANLGAATVSFMNMRVAGEGGSPPPQEPRNITICSMIDPNGDADTESMGWDYDVYVQGQQVPLASVPLNVVEGPHGWACDTVDLVLEGVANETAFTVTQSVEPLWEQAPGYPGWSAGGAPGSGSSASFIYDLGSQPYFNVTFQNKEAVVASPPDPTGTPTPPANDPDPDPTGTPTPPADDPDPDPTGTPTPPANDPDPDPTSTPTPPANDPDPDPTGTPTPPTNDPDPDPTGTPESPADDSGPAPADTGDDPAASATEAAAGDSTPVPPSAGTGSGPSTGGRGVATLIGAALVALGALSTAGSLAWRRRQ